MELKKPTTYDKQLKTLKARGCAIDNYEQAKNFLSKVNYYRLSAYFLPFRSSDSRYKEGTSIQTISRIYEFDSRMRGIVFSIIQEIEVFLRTRIAYFHAHKYGAKGYLNPHNFNYYHNHQKFETLLSSLIYENRDTLIVKHHKQNYDGFFPVWVIVELFPLGMLSHFYGDLRWNDQRQIANEIGAGTDKDMRSWLRCCTDLRNICAHYGRLYYRIFSSIPSCPNGSNYIMGRKFFDEVLMLKFLYPDGDEWNNQVIASISALLDEYEDAINLEHIGFPPSWRMLLHR